MSGDYALSRSVQLSTGAAAASKTKHLSSNKRSLLLGGRLTCARGSKTTARCRSPRPDRRSAVPAMKRADGRQLQAHQSARGRRTGDTQPPGIVVWRCGPRGASLCPPLRKRLPACALHSVLSARCPVLCRRTSVTDCCRKSRGCCGGGSTPAERPAGLRGGCAGAGSTGVCSVARPQWVQSRSPRIRVLARCRGVPARTRGPTGHYAPGRCFVPYFQTLG